MSFFHRSDLKNKLQATYACNQVPATPTGALATPWAIATLP